MADLVKPDEPAPTPEQRIEALEVSFQGLSVALRELAERVDALGQPARVVVEQPSRLVKRVHRSSGSSGGVRLVP